MSAADDAPPRIPETPSRNDAQRDYAADCPFCTIAAHFRPTDPLAHAADDPVWDPDKLVPPSYVLLATEHVVAFLDIAPLTRGHVLVAPRKHRVKVGDMAAEEMAELGRLLPLLTRSVIRSVLPDIPHDEADYNVVQNNGPGAAQVIPHVHFHIVPRPPLDYQPQPLSLVPSSSSSASSQPSQPPRKYPMTKVPTGLRRSAIQFGRGVRQELDDDEAAELVRVMRRHVAEAWRGESAGGAGGVGLVARVKDAVTRVRGSEKL